MVCKTLRVIFLTCYNSSNDVMPPACPAKLGMTKIWIKATQSYLVLCLIASSCIDDLFLSMLYISSLVTAAWST